MSLRIAICGHVDHGKSTLIGRLLNDCGQVKEDRARKVQSFCENAGRRFEYAFLLDGLAEEQEKGITIDVTEVSWNFQGREFTIIDTPGHREFLKNMVGGASRADAGVLLFDVGSEIQDQFKRHAAMLGLLGISRVIVVLNKMDLVDWSEDVFFAREREILEFFASASMPRPVILPAAAWMGANLIHQAAEMPWYRGPTLAQLCADIPPPKTLGSMALRIPLQGSYVRGGKEIFVGRVEAGSLKVGDPLVFLPSGKKSVVASLEIFGEPGRRSAEAGESIGFTLGEPLALKRGELGCGEAAPALLARQLRADIFWLAKEKLEKGATYQLRCGTKEVGATVSSVTELFDSSGCLARVNLQLSEPIGIDHFASCESTGRFILSKEGQALGGGRILAPEAGAILWMTGLSGAGKSTLAEALEKRLQSQGLRTKILDGDVLRTGLCRGLGFSDADRSENVRRTAEVAKLFAESGMVTIVALISPFAADRDNARLIAGKEKFLEIFVDCPLSQCEKRDPKGLYKKVRKGEISHFTGIHSRYDAPGAPDLHLRTDKLSIDAAVQEILGLFSPDEGLEC